METPKVTIGLYRHFKGEYYYVTGLSKHAIDEETIMVNYFNVCHPEYGNCTRPLDSFIATYEEDGRVIAYREDNVTGQVRRFDRVRDLNFQLGSVSTEQLIAELSRRKDSPLQALDIDGLNGRVFSTDYAIGTKHYATEDFPSGVDTVCSFFNEKDAKKYYESHQHRRNTSIFKRTFIEVE